MFNGFVTLKHTGDNIEGGGVRLSADQRLEFILSQFGCSARDLRGLPVALLSRLH